MSALSVMASVSSTKPFAQPLNTFDRDRQRAIDAVIINVSGRQRMLSQQIARLVTQLVWHPEAVEPDTIYGKLEQHLAQLLKAHEGLLYGDIEINLPRETSPAVLSMYFDGPTHLDRKLRRYVQLVQDWMTLEPSELTLHTPMIWQLVTEEVEDLVYAIDTVVMQYQFESEARQELMMEQLLDLCDRNEQQNQTLEQALADIKQLQTQLIQTEKISGLGQIAAGMAHEINNPNNFILANLHHTDNYSNQLLQLIALYERGAQQSEINIFKDEIDLDFIQTDFPQVLSSMEKGASRIQKIVRDLRTFARLDESEVKMINLPEAVSSVVLMLNHRLTITTQEKEQSIALVQNHDISIPPVTCHAGQLNQVIFHLLNNAIDALSAALPAQPQIQITTTLKDKTTLQIRVTDNGPGIPQAIEPKIFDPFFTTKPIGKGTGLGLSLCYQLMQAQGGSICYQPAPSCGACFVVEVPISAERPA